MALPTDPGYEGFEDPEDLYPGDTADLPTIYTGTYQIRQFGVGNANAIGGPPNILAALSNPPTAMVTAASHVVTDVVYTANDLNRYYPDTTANPNE